MATNNHNKAANRRGRPFEPGHSGRPKGTRNKLSQQQLRDARKFFLPMLEEVQGLIAAHFKGHLKEAPDCPTCRHYVGIVLEYVFGKPPQRSDIDLQNAQEEAERIADELGLPEEEKKAAIAEVQAILKER